MEIEIKRLFQEKIIKIVDNENLILDIKELIEYDLETYDLLLKNTRKFLSIVREESKIYNIFNPNIKIINWKEDKDISKIRVESLNETVKLDGMISKITDPMALVISKSFSCPSCGILIKTLGQEPNRCSCGRKGGFKEEEVILQDIQEIILEELQERTGGKQPQKIRIRITDKLTGDGMKNVLRAGNRVSVIGTIEKIKLGNKMDEEIFQYRIFALDISNLEDRFDDTINEEDVKDIEEISSFNPLDKLSKSLAPNIYGRDELKKILILQMVGGVKKTMLDGKTTRNWSHVLVVGPPATSKSELAKNIILRTPGSFYTSGDNASGVGITASIEKDELLGNWGVSAGPMIKANGSTMVADELDKFPKEQLKSLHTPMELGFVKVSKAGIDTQFPAETSVLALANPKYGIFEDTQPLVQQINLPPALLSRFDIIYVLRDDIDKDMDDMIVEAIYSNTKKEEIDIISVNLFRKYISYAKKIEPELPIEHLKNLQIFYNDIRKKSMSSDSKMKGMPIGARHLQGIIRLAEASAKIRLSNRVDDEDIKLAQQLFYDSLIKIGMDEGGFIDVSRISTGKSISKIKLMDFIMDKVRILFSNNEEISNDELKRVLSEDKFPMDKFEETIEILNREGNIIKSGKNWKLC